MKPDEDIEGSKFDLIAEKRSKQMLKMILDRQDNPQGKFKKI